MPRTYSDLVKSVLLSDYGPKRDGSMPSLSPFITAANLLMTRVAACAAKKGQPLSEEELTVVETWLAAHFYAVSDSPYQSTMTDRAQATFQGKTGMGLNSRYYGQQAMLFDTSGCLSAINARKTAGVVWMGKRPDDATAYEDRG